MHVYVQNGFEVNGSTFRLFQLCFLSKWDSTIKEKKTCLSTYKSRTCFGKDSSSKEVTKSSPFENLAENMEM